MSFLNDSIQNDLSCRFNKITGDQFFIKDQESGNFAFFAWSGSGEVPYYIKPDKIKLENESKFTEILESGVNINGEVLNQNNLTELNKIIIKAMWLIL
jgi:hypothetical protein